MTTVNNIVNELIKSAKNLYQGDYVRFIKGYSDKTAEKPVNSLVAAVDVREVSRSQDFIGGYFSPALKGEFYNVKLSLRVYAGRKGSGENLGKVTMDLLEALNNADEDSIIESSAVSPIEYDSQLMSIYREINLNLGFCLCGEV